MHALLHTFRPFFLLAPILLSVVALALYATRSRRPFIDECTLLTERLPSNRLSGLFEYENYSDLRNDQVFWKRIHGISGLIAKQKDRRTLIELTQSHRYYGIIDDQEADELIRYASLQLFYFLLALPEAALCAVWKPIPHVAARMAISYHLRLSLSFTDLCCKQDSPDCIFANGRIL